MGSIEKISVSDFDLKKAVECGQIFRWDFIDRWYYITIGEFILKARQRGNLLEYECSKPIGKDFIKNYFTLSSDSGRMRRSIEKDDKIRAAVKSASGLHLINQPPFECMISYIASSASNIPRIKKNMNSISRSFGKRIALGDYESYSFPKPSEFLKCKNIERELRCCGLGFRSKFYPDIINVICSVSGSGNPDLEFEKFFSRLKKMKYENAKSELVRLPGIGSKIADCILLFSLGFTEAFPTDVWIRRAVQEMYFPNENITSKKAEEFGREYFGRYAGYAQECIYYWRRLIK
ncbi:MAG: hypothetical protein NTV63_00170 [Candidatus Woesearchaeota archaeon]|nr:hypothetical protein [Candidatus Woesearchaeota archaeon]